MWRLIYKLLYWHHVRQINLTSGLALLQSLEISNVHFSCIFILVVLSSIFLSLFSTELVICAQKLINELQWQWCVKLLFSCLVLMNTAQQPPPGDQMSRVRCVHELLFLIPLLGPSSCSWSEHWLLIELLSVLYGCLDGMGYMFSAYLFRMVDIYTNDVCGSLWW